jgi:hypothetical protein
MARGADIARSYFLAAYFSTTMVIFFEITAGTCGVCR